MSKYQSIILKEGAGAESFVTCAKMEANDDEMSIVGYGSKPTPDRDKELVESSAWRLDNYRKNPVLLLAHKYDVPPVGKVLWIKSGNDGLRFKAKFASTERGKEIYTLYKEGILNAFSVGFNPMPDGFVDHPQDAKYKGLRRVYKDVELLEISCMPIPANADALVEFVKSGKVKNKQLHDEFEDVLNNIIVDPIITLDEAVKDPEVKTIDDIVETKGVIPYHSYGTADEGTSWDGPAAKKAGVDVLKQICAWYDSSKPDDQGSYKLPHHEPSSKKAVWKGVAAAMAAVAGARGGVNIPEGDIAGVKSHLEKHYKEFGKDVPKEFDEAILKELFPEDYADPTDKVVVKDSGDDSDDDSYDDAKDPQCPAKGGTFGEDFGKYPECKTCKFKADCKKETNAGKEIADISLKEVILEMQKQIEELKTKTHSQEGLPSVYDITSSINDLLNSDAPDDGDDDANERRYIVDLFPSNYPSGHIVYCEYTYDNPSSDAVQPIAVSVPEMEYYKVDYTYDMTTGDVAWDGVATPVMQSWVTSRYINEEGNAKAHMEDAIIKEGRVISGSNRTLLSDALSKIKELESALQNLYDAGEPKPKAVDEIVFDIIDDPVKKEEEIIFDIEPEEKKEADVLDINEDTIKEVLANAMADFMGSLGNSIKQSVEDTIKVRTGRVI